MLIYNVIWRNPYTNPPNNYPRQLWSGEKQSGFIAAFFGFVNYGTGWCVSVTYVPDKPKVRWSKAAKAKNRKKRLLKRLQKKYPMFWKSFYIQEIKERSEYYDGEDVK